MLTSLPILIIEANRRCNCRCEMCDIWRSTESGAFSVSQLDPLWESLDRLGTRHIVFTGGEPLMNPDLFKLCRPFRERGMRITLLSTGLLVERYAAEIRQWTDEVIVSMDGPPAIHDEIRRTPGGFAKLARGVEALQGFPVSARCVVQKRNCEVLLETANAAQELGMNSISFLAADVSSTAFHRTDPWTILRQSEIAPDRSQFQILEQQLEALARHPRVADSGAHLARIAHRFRAQAGLEAPIAPPCNAPWVSAYLHSDGTVQPCFFHHSIGSTADGSLFQILNSHSATEFRDALNVAENPVCQRCVCSLSLKSDCGT